MTPGIKFSISSFLIYGLFARLLFSLVGPYADLLAVAAIGLMAWFRVIRMNLACRMPDTKYKIWFFDVGEELTLDDRRHLFRVYLVAALLLSLGALYVASLLYPQ